MKKLLLAIIITMIMLPAYSQNKWEGMAAGLAGNVRAVVMFNNEIYVGGSFGYDGTFTDQLNNISKWNGTKWLPVGNGMNGGIRDMIVHNNELYVAGNFTEAGGTPANAIAKFNGTTWTALGSGIDGTVRSLTVHNNNIIAAGAFSTAGGSTANNIAMWNGTSWSVLGSGITNNVNVVLPYKNELYAGGSFSSPGANLVKWNGTAWSQVGTGTSGPVNDMSFHKGELLIAGDFALPYAGVTSWDGTTFSGFASSGVGTIHAVISFQDTVRKGGNFGSFSGVQLYDGNNFTDMGTIPYPTEIVYNLSVIDGALYASGSFSGSAYNGIAKWQGTHSTIGINEAGHTKANFEVYPNPANGVIKVSIQNEGSSIYTLSLFDYTGKQVYNEQLNAASEKIEKSIDISGLRPGIYFLSVKDGKEKQFTKKIVVI
ncbi:MAG: T9SS type A sorting domain-containing protein [Bacteroidetes bacterium]|nr:T9SS type A sorting domain-containing protein [Bacteroidota bacterium]